MEGNPQIRAHYRDGLQALKREHRRRVTIKNPRHLTGSIDLDSALRDDRPHDAIWDYGVGVKQSAGCDRTVWIEVHPASSSHVAPVLAKLAWLRSWIREEAPAFHGMRNRYVWLATADVALHQNTPKRRLIAQHGLAFRSRIVDLDELST